jgi:hypothetical protein
MAEDRGRLESWWVRTPIGIFFLASGLWLAVVLSLGPPSFWYWICAILWIPCGLVWLVRPSVAVGLSAFPVIGMVGVLAWLGTSVFHGRMSFDPWGVATFAVITVALVLVLLSLLDRRTWKVWTFAVSLGLVLASFTVDRLFTNKIQVRTLTMQWSADGAAPWSDNVERGEHGEIPVVLYLKVKGGYCYDAVFSPELKARLLREGNPTATVNYNLFRDFGKERGYNIRSVDGIRFNLGDKTVRVDNDGYGGTVEDPGSDAECPR